jgi:hypothetical protein
MEAIILSAFRCIYLRKGREGGTCLSDFSFFSDCIENMAAVIFFYLMNDSGRSSPRQVEGILRHWQ